ncbi:hypothetical protein PROFUN_12669 [Planoprotostelium fungivorum]|uniref:Uncharacterized protein n=1 Tax=Planoprotostelium fungivorum TaxID=1890364 RepID=A0A2P6MTX1_9EUKA|nr:hypothetical protein PROFUN_15983 [Planoprotostelium fungivorum]PRP79735.1 hypothetical protein PROFUN_12669 [Planoprotostelium fungivorum]
MGKDKPDDIFDDIEKAFEQTIELEKTVTPKKKDEETQLTNNVHCLPEDPEDLNCWAMQNNYRKCISISGALQSYYRTGSVDVLCDIEKNNASVCQRVKAKYLLHGKTKEVMEDLYFGRKYQEEKLQARSLYQMPWTMRTEPPELFRSPFEKTHTNKG